MTTDLAERQRRRRVVFAADCDEDGNCPVCGTDHAECDGPGPTMDEMKYREMNGVLWARPIISPTNR